MDQIISQKGVESLKDIMSANILDGRRVSFDEYKAMDALLSGKAFITTIRVGDFFDAPERDDWPGWDHTGRHEEMGRKYWNWFFGRWPNGVLGFHDAPDLEGSFEQGMRFRGDIGQVSGGAFCRTLWHTRESDLWISILGKGDIHVVIEPRYDIAAYCGAAMERRLSKCLCLA